MSDEAGIRAAVVTGGSRGIGRAIARRLAIDGRAVVVTGLDEERLRGTAEELSNESGRSVTYQVADVRRPEAIEALFEVVDRSLAESRATLDVVVANAGIARFGPCVETDPEEFRAILETNLFGVFLTARAAIPRLAAGGGGDLVVVGSLAARYSHAGSSAYCASKAGVRGFCDALFQEVRGQGIRVTEIEPGSVRTDLQAGGGAEWMLPADDVAAAVASTIALPRVAHVSHLEIRPARPR